MTAATASIATYFHALADPLRVQIIEALRSHELCACDIADQLSVTQSKLSFHLKTLREASLIKGRQEGRWIYYRLNLAQFLELEAYLSEFRRHSPIQPARVCPD
ncbi:MAG: winged helix-turn-helix transcriptional regulator [Leptolyngbya sp. SIO4C1]|nr:winged helix-turn-helix transcriptional regulator [Leptolyngbya sp. SIO4C1]